MNKTPLDEIIQQIAETTKFTSDQVYVYFLLNVYGALDIDTILQRSKNRNWRETLPQILSELNMSGVVNEEDGLYRATPLKEFHRLISDNVELDLDHLKALKDFI